MTLEALYYAIYNLIKLKPANDQWGVTKEKKTNLIEYIDMVEQMTEIRVKGLEDLEAVEKELQRRVDKHSQRFPDNVQENDPIPIMIFIYRVFELMEWEYNPEMTMNEFFNLMDRANQKAKQIEIMNNKYPNG